MMPAVARPPAASRSTTTTLAPRAAKASAVGAADAVARAGDQRHLAGEIHGLPPILRQCCAPRLARPAATPSRRLTVAFDCAPVSPFNCARTTRPEPEEAMTIQVRQLHPHVRRRGERGRSCRDTAAGDGCGADGGDRPLRRAGLSRPVPRRRPPAGARPPVRQHRAAAQPSRRAAPEARASLPTSPT